MTRIVLLRHGESSANTGDELGVPETPLTDTGHVQARDAAHKVVALGGPFHLISSPYKRALDTAQHVASVIGHRGTIETDHRMREREFGAWSARKPSEMGKAEGYVIKVPGVKGKTMVNPDWHPEGGETLHDVRRRAVAAVNDAVAKHPGKTIVFATHGHVIRALSAHYSGSWASHRRPENAEIRVFHHGVAEGLIETFLETGECGNLSNFLF